MGDWRKKVQEFVDGIASSVAVVGLSDDNQLVVTACNEQFFEMLGRRRATVHTIAFPIDTVIPSYSRRELCDKLHQCFKSGIAQEVEQAYDLKDGTHWWRLSLKPLRDTDTDIDLSSTSFEILVTGLDITAKMLLTHQLEVSTSRFRSVVNAAYDAIVTVDQQHKITLFNRSAEHLFGYDQAEMIGQPLEILIPEGHRAGHRDYVHQFARSPVVSRQMDERNRVYGLHRDGTKVPVEIAISKINVDGLIEFTAIIRDITDRVHLMDLLQKQAATDDLTGLPNRREFTLIAEEMMRTSAVVSFLILDVDRFKKVNDTYGHDAGDEVLRLLAKVGMTTIRSPDIFARLGGEEFVAALPQTDLINALALAERLRLIFEQQDFDHTWDRRAAIPFTVSIGVATRTKGDADIGAILKRADRALYKAKESGRNCVVGG